MPYSTDFPDAAHRHLDAAEHLHEADAGRRRRDIAGYLYGLAAECAVKQLLRRSIPGREPEHAHFPELKTVVRDCAQGRYASVLRRFAEDTGFMNEWNVKMRYAHRRDISDTLVDRWRGQAKRVIAAMDES